MYRERGVYTYCCSSVNLQENALMNSTLLTRNLEEQLDVSRYKGPNALTNPSPLSLGTYERIAVQK